ncbi:MAG: transposase [Nibricoccus sp.]
MEYAGECYHVINRGNYRRNLFEGGGAAEAFERTLGEAAVRFGWRIHAYVVMRNHFHLAVELSEPNLSEGMKWLQGTWVRRYNGLRKLIGRPFQDRYKGLVIEPGHALGQVCHYIHLNPVRAGAVEAAKVVEYAWSSLPKFLGKNRPVWLEPRTVLLESGDLRDDKAGWKQYIGYLEFLATDEQAKKDLIYEKLSRGWCVGSSQFREEMRKGSEEGARFTGLGAKEARSEREQLWEEKLQMFARLAKVNLDALPEQKSHTHKTLLAAVMKQSTSVSNGWLAKRLGMGEPASASQFVRRRMLDAHGKRDVDALLSRVKT